MIGSDVGNVGEREFQSQTTRRFSRSGGRYRAIGQELELEFVPARNFSFDFMGVVAGGRTNGNPVMAALGENPNVAC